MSKDNLLNHLRELEVTLHQSGVRSDPRRLAELLHDSFVEFGRSGQTYTKADTIQQLPSEQSSGTIWSQDFSVTEIADGVALLTYKSGHLDERGEISRHTLRSSLWQQTTHGWQVRFHQGTATDPFAKSLK